MKHFHLRARSVRVTSVALLVAGGFVAVAPSASADAPNSRAGATHASALNTAIKDTIATTGDQDWYRFVPAASGWDRITVIDMPSNDRLDLYSASGTLLTSSARPYHQFEEVYRSLAAGTYFVRVESQDGTFNATTPYVLKFATLSTGVKVLDLSWWRTSTGISFVCDLLNNTGHNINNPDLTAYLYDSTGHQIALSYNVFSDPQIIGARHRGDCNGQFNPNSRAASVRLKFRTVTTSPAAPFPLSVYNVHGVSTATGGVFTGDVKNPSSADAQGVVVGLMVYGPNGVIRTVSVVDGFLDDVAPGHSVAFQTVADPRAVPTDVIRGWAYPSF